MAKIYLDKSLTEEPQANEPLVEEAEEPQIEEADEPQVVEPQVEEKPQVNIPQSDTGSYTNQQIMGRQFQQQPIESAEVGIIHALNPKKILDDIRLELLGYSYNPITKRYEKVKGMEALMNEKGIAQLLQIMSSYVNNLTTLSNLDKEIIGSLVVHICDATFLNVGLNWREYGILNKSSISTVLLKIEMAAVSALNRAKGSGDRNVVRNVLNETSRPEPSYAPPQPEGLLSKANIFKNRTAQI